MDFRVIKQLCRSLVRRGWGPVFAAHGVDLSEKNLERELRKPLRVDRTRPGFEDFCLKGKRALEPGDPARSLLYHGLASPDVHPTANGQPAPNYRYPTPAELDVLENFIYGLQPVKASALNDLFVGVFAYEYRPAASSAHGYHADFVFSRTGISRVGTEAAAWDGPSRSFRPDPEGRKGISVCPHFWHAPLSPMSWIQLWGVGMNETIEREISTIPFKSCFQARARSRAEISMSSFANITAMKSFIAYTDRDESSSRLDLIFRIIRSFGIRGTIEASSN